MLSPEHHPNGARFTPLPDSDDGEPAAEAHILKKSAFVRIVNEDVGRELEYSYATPTLNRYWYGQILEIRDARSREEVNSCTV